MKILNIRHKILEHLKGKYKLKSGIAFDHFMQYNKNNTPTGGGGGAE